MINSTSATYSLKEKILTFTTINEQVRDFA